MVLRKPFTKYLLVLLLAALGGALAAALASAGAGQPPRLFDRDFVWQRDDGSDLRITEDRALPLPYLFGDYDLDATVELHESSELDLLFRKVEPRIQRISASSGSAEVTEEFVQFHGRFHLLRLSTKERGPAYRSRDEALFGDAAGGVLLRAGVPATIKLEARGRRVRAVVAGRGLPWIETPDDHGNMTWITRGGTAVVHHLKVTHVARGGAIPVWLVAGAVAAIAALVLALCGVPAWRVGASMVVVLPIGGWLAHELVFAHLLPWVSPDLLALMCGALSALPAAIGLALPGRRGALVAVVGLLCAPLLIEAAASRERDRLSPLEDPRLDLYFGMDSGTGPADALARRVQSDSRVHTLSGPDTRVLFLGGEVIFEARPNLAEQVGLRTAIAVQQRLSRDVEGVVAPAVFGHSLQQLLWFQTFYLDYQPQAVVLGLTRFESIDGGHRRAREVLEDGPEPRSWSTLLDLRRRLADGSAPVSAPEDLGRSLAELDDLCRQRGCHLVLVTEPMLDPEMLAVAERFAAERSRPLVRDVITPAGEPRIGELVEVLVRLLQ